MLHYITKEFRFEAAHHLPGYDGPCANVHGHSYKLQVTVGGEVTDKHSEYANDYMVMDFKDLKEVVDSIIRDFDHSDLNKFFAIPTAECMARYIYKEVKKKLPLDIKLAHVRLWETETSFVDYGDLLP